MKDRIYPYIWSLLSVSAQFATVPLLSHFYTLEAIASFTWYVMISGLLSGILSLRLDLRLVTGIQSLLISNIIWVIITNVTILLTILTLFGHSGNIAISALSLSIALNNTFLLRLNRDAKYSTISITTLIQTIIFQILIILRPDDTGNSLLLCYLISSVIINIFFFIRYEKEFRNTFQDHRRILDIYKTEKRFVVNNIIIYLTNKSTVNWLPLVVAGMAGPAWMLYFNYANRGFRQLSNIFVNVSAAKFFKESQHDIQQALNDIPFNRHIFILASTGYVTLLYSAEDIVSVVFPTEWIPMATVFPTALVTAYCQYNWSVVSSLPITTKQEYKVLAFNFAQVFMIGLLWYFSGGNPHFKTTLIFLVLGVFSFMRYVYFTRTLNISVYGMFTFLTLEAGLLYVS